MKKTTESKVAPFADEIARQDGEVILNLTGDSLETIGGQLLVKNVSSDLKKRILTAMK